MAPIVVPQPPVGDVEWVAAGDVIRTVDDRYVKTCVSSRSAARQVRWHNAALT